MAKKMSHMGWVGFLCLTVWVWGEWRNGESKSIPLGLTAGPNGTVLLNGKPYRGMGINYFNCFYRTLQDTNDLSYQEGFRNLARSGVPFVRFCATGFWPRNMALYFSNREAYFNLLDNVVRSAEENHIGLIPSLFWCYSTVPDMVGETCDQWGNTNSKTHAFMRQYIKEFVIRYRPSPSIWAWEFGNEYDSYSDYPNAKELLPRMGWPRVYPNDGTPETRSEKDYPTFSNTVVAFREFASLVRSLDPHQRLIESGTSILRENIWHFMNKKTWDKDDDSQRLEAIKYCHPEPLDLISVHCYKDFIGSTGRRRDEMERLDAFVESARVLQKPVIVGEFQFPDDYPPESAEAKECIKTFLDKLNNLRVPLAMFWVYDFSKQQPKRSVTVDNALSWELELLRNYNEKAR